MQAQQDTSVYVDVTEVAGDEISGEQLSRLANRYYWAGRYAKDKDVIEMACGTGPGLGYLATLAKSLKGSDISDEVLAPARVHYGARVQIDTVDACAMPYDDNSADVILLFEAIYYLPDAEAFMAECARVLRTGGHVLIVSANKDLFDFNPSPHSHTYFGVVELKDLMARHGFTVAEMAGGTALGSVSLKQKILRPVKKIVVDLGLMPKSMAGKKLLKKLVFGNMIPMPHEIANDTAPVEAPVAISADTPCRDYKVLFCAGEKI